MPKLFLKFFSNFFFEQIIFGENFFYLIFFGENFCFHKNIFCEDFFTIFSRISFVFDVCEIMYLRNFLFEILLIAIFFVLQFRCTEKKIVNFFCDFFLAMNVNT